MKNACLGKSNPMQGTEVGFPESNIRFCIPHHLNDTEQCHRFDFTTA